LWITAVLAPALDRLACAGVMSFHRLRDAVAALTALCNGGEITQVVREDTVSRLLTAASRKSFDSGT
jgi:hypothetical protein